VAQPRPLAAAVQAGHLDAVELLLKYAAAEDDMFGNPDDAFGLLVQSKVPRQTELAKLLLDHGANINQQCRSPDFGFSTPILLASFEGNQELVNFLVEAGADWTAVDHSGRSVLIYAAMAPNPEVFASFVEKGASVHFECRFGFLALHVAMISGAFAGWILHADCRMELASPAPWWLARLTHPAWITTHFRFYQRGFSRALLQRIANLHRAGLLDWSPLCLMAVEGDTTGMANLIELGARLDHEGSPHGSALMAACANRQIEAVKFLVRRGESLSYISSSPRTRGRVMSCLTAAQGSPKITEWLLVGRFIEQKKIAHHDSEIVGSGAGDAAVKHWAGITKAELVITGRHERQPSESSYQYLVRLQQIRREMRGRRVPRAFQSGRRTCRPSRLVPEETVRISPDDTRVPRG
jgi:ankyrin repeat protein